VNFGTHGMYHQGTYSIWTSVQCAHSHTVTPFEIKQLHFTFFVFISVKMTLPHDSTALSIEVLVTMMILDQAAIKQINLRDVELGRWSIVFWLIVVGVLIIVVFLPPESAVFLWIPYLSSRLSNCRNVMALSYEKMWCCTPSCNNCRGDQLSL
jgi:hypothetical protein